MNLTRLLYTSLLCATVLPLLWATSPLEEEDNDKVQGYINRFSQTAILEMHLHGIPASIKLGQGILESTYGESPLALAANNHFGIKCGAVWVGETFYHASPEQEGGKQHQRSACFRKYSSPEESFRDHSAYLRSRQIYQWIFELNTLDYNQWAIGLQKAGYATDKDYAEKLVRVIERYNLGRFDVLKPGAVQGGSVHQNTNREQVSIGEVRTWIQDLESIVNQAEVHRKDLSEEQRRLQVELNQQRRQTNQDIRALQERIAELEERIVAQEAMIKKLNGRLSKVEQVQQSILVSDPLADYFLPDGTPKPTKEIFPKQTVNGEGVFYVNGRRAVALEGNTTLLGISQRFNLNYRDLLKYNDIEDELMLDHENCYIYLESKSNYTAGGSTAMHQVQPTETMLSIAQRHGIKLSKLYSRNGLKKGEEREIGEFIFLNSDNKNKVRVRRPEQGQLGNFGGGGLRGDR